MRKISTCQVDHLAGLPEDAVLPRHRAPGKDAPVFRDHTRVRGAARQRKHVRRRRQALHLRGLQRVVCVPEARLPKGAAAKREDSPLPALVGHLLSGLAEHMPLDKVAGAMVICICNLPARKMGGLESQAMVLCASDKDKTALCFVAPPEGSAPGDKVTWEGYPGEPEAPKKMQKKKAWEAVQPLLATSASGVAVYKEAPFSCPKGQCTATVKGGIIS